MTQPVPRVWLITGSSSGFGRAMVEEALGNGEIVIATLRNPSVLDGLAEKYPRTHLLVLQLDVTDEAQVKSVFTQAKDVFGHVDVVYNNAGQGVAQELEGLPMDRARMLMDVNFWGAVRVSLEAVRFFREENPQGTGGMLVQVSSMAATKGIPLSGYYSATKAALDSFTEVLAQELLPTWNIRLLIVHPGFTRTNLLSDETLQAEPPTQYSSEPTSTTMQMREGWNAFINSDVVVGVEGVTKRIWSVTHMDKANLRKGEQDGIPGLVNMFTGMDSLEVLHAKIGRLHGELQWNMKVHYEY